MNRKLTVTLVSLVIVAIILAAFALSRPRDGGPTPPYSVSLAAQGTPVVDATLFLITKVRGNMTTTTFPTGMFVYVGPTQSLRVNSPETGDDPWGLPNVWNVTGLDLSNGMEFALNTTPTSAAEYNLLAMIWSPRPNYTVEFDSAGSIVNLFSVITLGIAGLKLTVSQQSSARGATTDDPMRDPHRLASEAWATAPRIVGPITLAPDGEWRKGVPSTVLMKLSPLEDIRNAHVEANLTGAGTVSETDIPLGIVKRGTTRTIPIRIDIT